MVTHTPEDLVLVGGGHAHVQVLRSFMMAPLPVATLTLVIDRPGAVYSGMVPGYVAGDYRAQEVTIDCVPLARRAGARVILSAAVRIDPDARVVEFADRPPVPYDLASLDVGSTVQGLDLPGVTEHAVATRPISNLVNTMDGRVEGLAQGGQGPRLVVVGAGAAGVELASCLVARLRGLGATPASVTVLDPGAEPLPGASAGARRRLARVHREQNIVFRAGARVVRVDEHKVVMEGGDEVAADLVVWAAGAASPAVIRDSPLPHDDRGFVRVRNTLQVEGYDDLFAVGDCAALTFAPWVEKAGVYAVRGGAVLVRNLRARLVGAPLRRFRPQREFLALMNVGEGRAIASRGRWSLDGRLVYRLKDRIDRAFMRKFQVLDRPGRATSAFPPMAGGAEMVCGGCAAKVGRSVLEETLAALPPGPPDETVALGLVEADDVAAIRRPQGMLELFSIDAFTAFTDDPFLVGKVAALNAVSDVSAKGARARYALALVGIPAEDPTAQSRRLFQIMSGVRAALDPRGITLLGGHSVAFDSMLVGLTVWGEVPGDELFPMDGAREGDALVLTKALGTGVVFHADMQGLAPGEVVAAALQQMQQDNAVAVEVARRHGARAITDVSGFGLAGHLAQMLRASGCGAEISLDALPPLRGAVELFGAGIRSTFHAQNEIVQRGLELADGAAAHDRFPLVFDPQTSGGLLLSVPAEHAPAGVEELRTRGYPDANIIGRVVGVHELAAFRVVV